MPTLDRLQRPMRDLRISVTDRCNFRCTYCMPYDEYTWIERREVLSFEEIERVARLFLGFGYGQELLAERAEHLAVAVFVVAFLTGFRPDPDYVTASAPLAIASALHASMIR